MERETYIWVATAKYLTKRKSHFVQFVLRLLYGETNVKGDREEGGGESDARPYGMDLVAECDDNVPNEERERGDCAW